MKENLILAMKLHQIENYYINALHCLGLVMTDEPAKLLLAMIKEKTLKIRIKKRTKKER